MPEHGHCRECGAELYKFGPITGPETGEEYRCSDEDCGYVERRL